VTRRLGIATFSLAGFVTVALLVASGGTSSVDQFSVDHLMLGLYPYVDDGMRWSAVGAQRAGWLSGPISSATNPDRIVNRIADVAYIPASGFVASALVFLLIVVALFRGQRIAAACWAAAYAAGNGFEIIGKELIERPQLYVTAQYGSVPIWKFDTSFPSGHTIRAILLAALVAWMFPTLRTLAAAWAAIVVVLLVVAGTHTPTDVAGGLLVAVALLALRGAAEARLA
jgi:membrane-associated phospholipid phosphatase